MKSNLYACCFAKGALLKPPLIFSKEEVVEKEEPLIIQRERSEMRI